MFDSIGFIGAGRIAHIMLGGWQRAGTKLPPFLIHDPSVEALSAVTAAFPHVRAASLEEAGSQALVFLAIHPPVMGATLAGIAPRLRRDALVVSLAPRVRLASLQAGLGGFGRVARMNPNAPSIVGAGFNPISLAPSLPEETRRALLAAVAPLGAAPVVDDNLIEACAVVSAMGPTYFWFQFEALRELAEGFGLEPTLARDAVRTMLHGAVETLFDGSIPASRIMDLVPVRPLAAGEETIREMLRAAAGGAYARLTTP